MFLTFVPVKCYIYYAFFELLSLNSKLSSAKRLYFIYLLLWGSKLGESSVTFSYISLEKYFILTKIEANFS